jgi:hypothetical protein
VRIGGLPLLYADVHARRLDPVDLHGHNSSPVADIHQRRGCGYDPGYCNRAKLPTLGILADGLAATGQRPQIVAASGL